jgi:hypothetical protein
MRELKAIAAFLLGLFVLPPSTAAEDSWSAEQEQVLTAIQHLSATTAPGGSGADGYGRLLSEGFSRWTVGSEIVNGKEMWVEGIREWFDAGWRVSDRKSQTLEIQILGDTAFTRRLVTETYLGPEDETSTSSAALAEVWVRAEDGWLLHLVNVHPLDQ